MTSSLPPEQVSDLRAAFALFDDNGDGEITAAELGSVMRSLGLKPSDTELQDLMNEIDVDQSGTISFEGRVFCFECNMPWSPDVFQAFSLSVGPFMIPYPKNMPSYESELCCDHPSC